KEACLNAIHKDNIEWSQVSELPAWTSSTGKHYGIRSIPAHVLIAPEGTIIARNLRGADFRKKVSSLLNIQ
ncbi:MAG: hypothetical protein K8S00_13495, partial [Bacteroidales bacterium]|nr:hypothetical protein [Bacteroidales bacterium]